jgi:Holliday junction resolvasome RuvABC DNA-binding subunit
MKSLESVKGIGPYLAKGLAAHGLSSPKALATAAPAEVASIPGIGPARAARLVLAAQAFLAAVPEEPVTPAEAAADDPPKESKKAQKKDNKKKGDKKKSKSKKAKKSDKKSGGKSKKKKKSKKGK